MKRNTDIKQHDVSDCAVACMASIAAFYGRRIPLAVIREASGTSGSGTTIKGITDACGQIGFLASGYKSPSKKLAPLGKLKEPVILHIVNKAGDLHFIVLYSVGRTKATVMDPKLGKHKRMDISELESQWSGFLVTMRPDPDTEKSLIFPSGGKGIMRYARHLSAADYVMLMFSSVAYIVAGICTALFLQHIIDTVLPDRDINALMKTGGLLLAILVCTLTIGYGRAIYALRLSISMDGSLTMKYLKHLLNLPASFFSRRGTGELNSRISDVSKIRSFLISGISDVFTSLLILIVSFTLMFTAHWRLSLLMLTFIPIYLLLYVIADKVNGRVNRDIIESSATFQESTVESICAVRTMKYFNGEGLFFSRLQRDYAVLAQKLFSGGKWAGGFATASDAISKMLTITLLTVGSLYIFAGTLTIGELVSFYSLTSYFATPLGNLVSINDACSEARIAAERISDILDLDPEYEPADKLPISSGKDIVFDSISFSYPGSPQLIKDFSLTLESGRITAVQGKSGCGKSSLASLLMRDFKVQKGHIRLGPVDIGHTDLRQWRRYVSIVPQDPVLFNCSVLDNITCMDRVPDMERVASILKDLGLEKFIRDLPMGILTKLGERGCMLSGGQRQRIALARALYRDPQVLILDEATSSLDGKSQEIILNKILQLRDEGKTIMMITHKSDNARIADRIVNL